jgi:hypothetical protein
MGRVQEAEEDLSSANRLNPFLYEVGDNDAQNYCLYCSGGQEDGELIQIPCRCQNQVHMACLSEWITSIQKARNRKVNMLQCEVSVCHRHHATTQRSANNNAWSGLWGGEERGRGHQRGKTVPFRVRTNTVRCRVNSLAL